MSECLENNLQNLNEKYIMHPKLHKELSRINGFTNLNGDNYMKHICIIFDKNLNSQQKIKILECKTNTQALNKLNSFGLSYTHTYSWDSEK